MGLANGVLLVRKNNGDYIFINPFKDRLTDDIFYYVQDYTIIHHFFLTTKEYCSLQKEDKYYLTETEQNKVNKFLHKETQIQAKKHPIIICLIESLNSFVITKDFMPNLQCFIDTSKHILIGNNITSQVKGGISADGQMIVQTGILPVNEGATCFRFGLNKYPSLSHLYSSSAIILGHSKRVWNQVRMSLAYGQDTIIEVISGNDKELFNKTLIQSEISNYIMVITASTHIPYTKYADSSAIYISDNIPSLLKNYIKSANVLDKGMQILFNEISSNEKLKNSTIVITGDHNLPAPSDENYNNVYNYSRSIPLIIYSPEIKQKTIITDTCYQMDIYPTILHLIGCEDYYWKGFGVNLLDSAARHNRPITPEEAYDL